MYLKLSLLLILIWTFSILDHPEAFLGPAWQLGTIKVINALTSFSRLVWSLFFYVSVAPYTREKDVLVNPPLFLLVTEAPHHRHCRISWMITTPLVRGDFHNASSMCVSTQEAGPFSLLLPPLLAQRRISDGITSTLLFLLCTFRHDTIPSKAASVLAWKGIYERNLRQDFLLLAILLGERWQS